MMSLMFAMAIFAAPDAAQAATPTTVEPAVITSPKGKPGPNEMVCKREPVLGSRMKERLCMTQADWDQRRIDARDEIEKKQTNVPVR